MEKDADVAQEVERQIHRARGLEVWCRSHAAEVPGSIPGGPILFIFYMFYLYMFRREIDEELFLWYVESESHWGNSVQLFSIDLYMVNIIICSCCLSILLNMFTSSLYTWIWSCGMYIKVFLYNSLWIKHNKYLPYKIWISISLLLKPYRYWKSIKFLVI